MKLYKALISELTDSDFEAAVSKMSETRKSTVFRYKSENDRKRTVLGEILAKRAINEIYGIAYEDIVFERSENGKPFLRNADFDFSISHSKDLVVCAVSDGRIGIDAEQIREIDLRITRLACTDDDIKYIFNAEQYDGHKPGKDEIKRFFEVWTAKEAYFKYLGTGIEGLKDVSYSEIKPFCKTETDGEYIITIFKK